MPLSIGQQLSELLGRLVPCPPADGAEFHADIDESDTRLLDHLCRLIRGPGKARTLAERLEIHYTPKHGSWLNIAEIELSRLTRQCLDRRIDDLDLLNVELAAWQTATNDDQRQVDWQFSTSDAPSNPVTYTHNFRHDGLLDGQPMYAPEANFVEIRSSHFTISKATDTS